MAEKRYRYLEHTADAKFQAYGDTLEEAFVNAAIAMFDILADTDNIKPKIRKEIVLKSRKKESLLYDFLEELLFFLDVDGFLLSRISEIKIRKDEDYFYLDAAIFGDSYRNYEVKGNIKSITYSDMEIIEDENGVTVQAVVDI